ncbi:MAG: hypothetical protein KJ674_01400 [Nanoarchaeota archaeon]|nr:hypothetical protein [Nanoarchaeota archaeon]
MIYVKFKGGNVKRYYFDEIGGITEQGGYFIVKHIAGFTIFDKTIVDKVSEKKIV